MAAPIPRVPPVTRATRSRTVPRSAACPVSAGCVDVVMSCSLLARSALCALLRCLLQPVQHRRVTQRGGIPGLAALRYVAQEPAHDLAGPGLGQVISPDDPFWPCELPDLVAHVPAEILAERGPRAGVLAERDVGDDRLAGGLVADRDDRGLGHRGVGDERRFDLGGGQPVPGDVDDVVDPAGDPEVAVLVAPCAVADEVDLWPEALEVGPDEPVPVVVERAEHARPGLGEDEHAAALADLVPLLVEEPGGHAR